jgi:hypothetical protein
MQSKASEEKTPGLDVCRAIEVPLGVDHPLSLLRSYHVLNAATCKRLVEAAECAAEARGGWTTERHKKAATTDLPFSLLGGERQSGFNHWKETFVRQILRPLLLRDYGADFKGFNDLFLVKYSAGSESQRALKVHRDGTLISFVLQLNDSFEGGGTTIEALGESLLHNVGDLCIHCGWLRHGGAPVTSGERYVLIGFCNVEAPWLDPSIFDRSHPIHTMKRIPTDREMLLAALGK